MSCWVLRVSAKQFSVLREAPSLVTDLVCVALPDAGGSYEDEGQLPEARQRLAPLGPLQRALDLEKSWHILHYLFTGCAWDAPAPGGALLSGEVLGDDLVGYGPARLHGVEETRDFAQFLQAVDAVRLQEQVDHAAIERNRIYPFSGGGLGSAASLEAEIRYEVADCVPRLQRYVAAAADAKDGLLIWIF